MSDLLSEDDLIQLTGCTQKAKQIDVLKANGIRFFERFDGKPVVVKEALILALKGSPSEQVDSSDGFNLQAIQH